MTDLLTTFPFLTALEFEHACRVLAHRACTCTTAQDGGGWSSMRLVTQNAIGLKITRRVDVHRDSDQPEETEGEGEGEGQGQGEDLQDAAEASALEDEDEDPVRLPKEEEALIRSESHPKLHIEYDILLSPTYQVPVLYFALHWDKQEPLGLDVVYRYLVPDQYRQQVKSVGVMGGISFGYHPESGAPAFFVHPCNTADAMGQVANARTITPESYLLIWLGLVGQCVSLYVPRELVISQDSASPS